MPRKPRLDAPGVLHHVMGRGIEGTDIFRDNTDRNDFLKRLAAQCDNGRLILGVTSSAVNRIANSEELPVVEKYSKLS